MLTATSTGVYGSAIARGGDSPTLTSIAFAWLGASHAITEPLADNAGRWPAPAAGSAAVWRDQVDTALPPDGSLLVSASVVPSADNAASEVMPVALVAVAIGEPSAFQTCTTSRGFEGTVEYVARCCPSADHSIGYGNVTPSPVVYTSAPASRPVTNRPPTFASADTALLDTPPSISPGSAQPSFG